jgi:hypothetical protein
VQLITVIATVNIHLSMTGKKYTGTCTKHPCMVERQTSFKKQGRMGLEKKTLNW